MPMRDTAADRVRRWQERLTAADKVFTRWEEDYDCKRLVKYYAGKQWRGVPEDRAKELYTINLVFPTIENQLPSLMFYRPQVKVEARPAHSDDQNSDAAGRANLIEATLQTFIDDPKLHFKHQTILALRD